MVNVMKNRNMRYPYYDVPDLYTLRELIENGKNKGQDRTVFYTNDVEQRPISFIEFSELVFCLGTFLLARGYRKNNIGILSENRFEWCLSFFGICNSSNVVVPLDKNENKEEIIRLIKHSECKALFYSEKYKNIIEEAEDIVCFSIDRIDDYVEEGRKLIEEGNSVFESIEIDKKDLAAIVYTSGTTGDKKGVMLSHENIVTDTVATCRNVIASNTQILLPFYHTFSWASGMLAVFIYCVDAHISIDLKRIIRDLKQNRPQNISAVPMMVEMIYKNIWNNAKKQNKQDKLKNTIALSNFLMNIGIDLRKKLFKEIHESLGGNLETIICGGAALDKEIEKSLYDLGFTVISGYGISECSPVVAVNRNRDFRFGSVGRVLSCNEVRINDPDEKGIGEIYVSGSNVMSGYYKDEEATRDAFDGKWFKTGDYGYMDDGFLYITGRKKNLIVLANGENVSAEEIEQKLLKIEHVKEVLVYEENKKIVAEFYLDGKITEEKLKADVDKYNRSVPQHKNISYIKIRNIPFEKTTTLKIKRDKK